MAQAIREVSMTMALKWLRCSRVGAAVRVAGRQQPHMAQVLRHFTGAHLFQQAGDDLLPGPAGWPAGGG